MATESLANMRSFREGGRAESSAGVAWFVATMAWLMGFLSVYEGCRGRVNGGTCVRASGIQLITEVHVCPTLGSLEEAWATGVLSQLIVSQDHPVNFTFPTMLVHEGYQNKLPQNGRLKQQQFISQFWKLEM